MIALNGFIKLVYRGNHSINSLVNSLIVCCYCSLKSKNSLINVIYLFVELGLSIVESLLYCRVISVNSSSECREVTCRFVDLLLKSFLRCVNSTFQSSFILCNGSRKRIDLLEKLSVLCSVIANKSSESCKLRLCRGLVRQNGLVDRLNSLFKSCLGSNRSLKCGYSYNGSLKRGLGLCICSRVSLDHFLESSLQCCDILGYLCSISLSGNRSVKLSECLVKSFSRHCSLCNSIDFVDKSTQRVIGLFVNLVAKLCVNIIKLVVNFI